MTSDDLGWRMVERSDCKIVTLERMAGGRRSLGAEELLTPAPSLPTGGRLSLGGRRDGTPDLRACSGRCGVTRTYSVRCVGSRGAS